MPDLSSPALPAAAPACRGRCKRLVGRAFTLVELLVVVGIIAVLMAILLPTMSRAVDHARTVQCLSNLRQLSLAAQMYAGQNRGFLPPSHYTQVRPPLVTSFAWDFTIETDTVSGTQSVKPGLVWSGATAAAVQQCPAFELPANWAGDPYTGYNYNTSYLGGEQSGSVQIPPAKITAVRKPSQTAIFGDGQYAAGANKFMRAPFYAPAEVPVPRFAGTQGFRHRRMTNVAFVDGHAQTLQTRFTMTVASQIASIAPQTGFLSVDNSLYDLE